MRYIRVIVALVLAVALANCVAYAFAPVAHLAAALAAVQPH